MLMTQPIDDKIQGREQNFKGSRNKYSKPQNGSAQTLKAMDGFETLC